jgi:serpin B
MLLPFFLAVSVTFADEPPSDLRAAVAGNNTFALDLYSILKKEKGNLFFSPYSISSALAMTYGGARGDTAEEMAKALRFAAGAERTHSAFAELNTMFDRIQKRGRVQLHIANSLWPQKDYGLLPEYLTLTKRYYGVSITPVDYVKATEEARKIINTWVEDRTKDKIKELIRPGVLDPLTVLVLVNAIYFKGNWASQFDPKRTTECDFSLLGDAKAQVSMMHQKGKFGYGEIEGTQLLELPYVGKELSMVLILPAKPEGLSKVEDQLTVDNLGSWVSRISEQDVSVYLPRFKVTWGTFELNKPLQALGMRKAFVPGADFSGMDGTKSLFIGLVLHKAFVEVNEEGTEAAAATAVIMRKNGGRMHTFRADHPFLFFIRDNVTGSILFLGRVLDPSKEKD